jgi:hypothetical protein
MRRENMYKHNCYSYKITKHVKNIAVIIIYYFCGSTVLIRTRASSHMRFLKLFRHMVGLLGRVIRTSQGLYLHTTTQHRKTLTNIHALSGIRTHDSSNQPAKAHASDRTAIVTDIKTITQTKYNKYFIYSLLHTSLVKYLTITQSRH